MASTAPPATSGLKHLGVVPTTVSQASNLTYQGYQTVRKYVPGVAEPYVKSLEDVTTTYGAPVVTAATDYGTKVLQTVDGTVRALETLGGQAHRPWRCFQACSAAQTPS